MLSEKSDLHVYDARGLPLLSVAVDNRVNLTAEQALSFRRDVMPYLKEARTAYLLVVSQDTAYLWTHNDHALPETLPDASFSMQPILDRFWRDRGSARRMGAEELKIVVWRWLLDVTQNPTLTDSSDLVPTPFHEVFDRLRGGQVEMEAAA